MEVTPLVFLSYQWGKQPQVKALYNRLVSAGYTVWMDIFQMGGGDSLYDKIDRGMRGCKVVVTCITTKYSLSANCRREVSLADALKKPMVPLLLEEMKWPPAGPMSLMFTELLYINMYRDPHVQERWTGAQVNEMFEKLQQYVPDTAPVEKKDNNQTLGPKAKEIPKKQGATDKVNLKKDEPKSEHITTTAKPPADISKKRDTANQQKTDTVKESPKPSINSSNNGIQENTDEKKQSKSCIVL